MKSLISRLLITITLVPLLAGAADSLAAKDVRVAVLISGYGNQTNGEIGYDLEELAQSYLVLTDNGVQLDIISPTGGAVPVHNKKDDLEYIQRFKHETPALQQLNATLSAGQALENHYDGLMIIGGDGAMFDLPFDANTQTFIRRFVTAELPLAAVCHGPAALVNITLENGDYFLSGKRVNSFTEIEEQAFSAELIDKFPFMLQPTIEARGAEFVANAPMLPFVAQDGHLITAQNPMSVAKAAEALLVTLGITPKPRAMFKDEKTMELVSRARTEGAFMIDVALAKSAQQYDLNYLALYGFYAYRLATSEADKRNELTLMARIGQHFSHPQYAVALIEALLEQGKASEAQTEKQRLTQAFPDFELPQLLQDI